MALRQHARKTAPPVITRDSPAPTRVSLLDWLRKFFMQPAIGVTFATVSLVAVLLVGWLAVQNSQLRRQAEQLQARQTPLPTPRPDLQEQLDAERLRNEQLSAQVLRQQELLAEESQKLLIAQEQQTPPPPRELAPPSKVNAFVALALTPGATRDSGEWKKISLTPDTREVRIRLDLPAGGYRSYQAVLQTVEGQELLSRRGLRASGRGAPFVSLVVPARRLKPNDYQLSLTGVTSAGELEDISSYYFRVLK